MGLLRELYRDFRIAWHKPGHWRLRPHTIDRRIFRNVVVENEYRLPSQFDPTDVVLDIGGHVGTFAHVALSRGAGVVHCFEPDAGNFAVLAHNLAPYGKRARVKRCAVWRSDVRIAALSLHNPHGPANTGGVQVAERPTAQSVEVLAFDDLVAAAVGPGRRVRLLKLDCEGAEWPILFTSRTLDCIDAICGEYHLGDYPEAFHVDGFPDFTPEVLERFLGAHGFGVTLVPNRRSPDRIGNFFARRAQS